MQIGHRGQSKGSLDTNNFNNAADIYVYPKTNEVFVADGYVNRRVIVLDADTGQFKRMWGAYGNLPDDNAPNRLADEGPDGKFQREIFVERKTKLLGTSFSVAFSPDARQDLLFLADAGNGKLHIYDRRTLTEVGQFGRIGRYAGEFIFLHNVSGRFERQRLYCRSRQRTAGSEVRPTVEIFSGAAEPSSD